MMAFGESDMNISSNDWDGAAHRKFKWGVHDDVSFEILGNLLINKTYEQTNSEPQHYRYGHCKQKLPSNHVEYKDRPTWYAEADKPDFSALYDDGEYAANVQNYLEMRYFTDVELGKFMDRMEAAGVLNDTIVLIVGDHGQAPEFGNDTPEKRDVSCTHVAGALIAEGRLGEYVGLKFIEHRLTRKSAEAAKPEGCEHIRYVLVVFGERVIYSNNPGVKNVHNRGHERLRYDRSTDSGVLHNAYADHDMKADLFPALSTEEKSQWRKWRDRGREVTA
ncbi:LOW QUALITY PROTEIN: Sulfatase-like protein [Phytophthora palmivora]|uniref:Sulfatase-like protein n=1 Tax=Phytophthora palmivora TaxID=4796 RepID=A0A2P4YGQ1_9STRA|nr:LOW QUALITY PROTEIN: Sulfatase-like protein [Phytophthora palmivora]